MALNLKVLVVSNNTDIFSLLSEPEEQQKADVSLTLTDKRYAVLYSAEATYQELSKQYDVIMIDTAFMSSWKGNQDIVGNVLADYVQKTKGGLILMNNTNWTEKNHGIEGRLKQLHPLSFAPKTTKKFSTDNKNTFVRSSATTKTNWNHPLLHGVHRIAYHWDISLCKLTPESEAVAFYDNNEEIPAVAVKKVGDKHIVAFNFFGFYGHHDKLNLRRILLNGIKFCVKKSEDMYITKLMQTQLNRRFTDIVIVQ